MKILFISAWYPNRLDPMAGLFVQNHADAVSLYADVKVLYTQKDESIRNFQLVINQHQHIEEYIVYYPTSKTSKIITFINYLLAYEKGFNEIKKKAWKPDIIQANVFTRTALIAYLYKLIHKTPYTVIEHWTRYIREKTFRNELHKWLSIFVAKKASAIMPVTFQLKKSMENCGMKNQNYQIINNVVSDHFFVNTDHKKNKKVKILNVTCFNDLQKNISGILRVIENLSHIRDDFEIYLVGTGVDFDRIVKYANELKIKKDIVYFTGLLEGEPLIKLFKECDFSLLFSNYENIPVVISESFACGKPVISTDIGGINEHVNQTNGLLISVNDEEVLLKSINWMIDNYNKYNSKRIIDEAYQRYSYEQVGEQIYSLYTKILSNEI